jgi:LCP family protein required for cell wall assembly
MPTYEPAPYRPPGQPADPAPPVRRSRSGPGRRRPPIGRIIGVLFLVLLLLIGGFLFWVNSKIRHIDALGNYGGRPAATPGQDWLLVGSDSREGLSRAQRAKLHTGQAAGRRTDTIMLMHISASGAPPVLLSLPRDSFVSIPGHGRNKLNAAYSFGGPKLLARTVEGATGIRLDHYMEIGFDGFVKVVDAAGGVKLCPPKAINDKKAHLDIKAGCQEFDGPTALGYVRARSFDPKGDLGRVERQQEFLGALMGKAASPGVLLNPLRLVPFTGAALDAIAVDDDSGLYDMARFALAMRTVAADKGVTTTVPVADTDFRPGGVGSTVLWDRDQALRLFQLLKTDRPVPKPELPSG